MPNVAVHKAGELKAETRAAVEAELGRSLRDDEEVSIMAFTPQEAPARGARREASRRLREHLHRIDQKSKDIPEEEAEGALNDAFRNVRPGYRERE